MCGSRGVVRGERGRCVNNTMFVPPPGYWGHPADLAGVIAQTLLVTLQTPLHYHSALSKLLLPLQFLCLDC